MTITYRDLLNKLKKLNEEQLNSDITISNNDEYYKATLVFTDKQIDILDEGHPVIVTYDSSVPF
jgi:hypothetical protein